VLVGISLHALFPSLLLAHAFPPVATSDPSLLTAFVPDTTRQDTTKQAPTTRDTVAVSSPSDEDSPLESALDDLSEETGDPVQLAERLAALRERPLDLNRAGADALSDIPGLSPLLAQRIVRHRQQAGPYRSLSALRSVRGVTAALYARVRPYLTVAPPAASRSPYGPVPSLRALRTGLEARFVHRITRRLDLGRGYVPDTTRTTYLGSPEQLFTRLRVASDRHFSANLTLDKDAGEAFRWDPATRTYGFDFISGHLALQDIGRLQTLVVGDFTAAYGQGLALWRGASFGKGRDPTGSMVRTGRGLAPYGSSAENRFLRGVGAAVRLTPALTVTAFGSRRTLDATLGAPVDTTRGDAAGLRPATTLGESGLHRTPSELAAKDALREMVGGGALTYDGTTLHLGVAGYHSRFDRPLQSGDAPYQQFDFAGSSATMVSVFGRAFWDDAMVFGEVGRAPGGAIGGLGGVAWSPSDRFEGLVVGRLYPRAFTSLHGYAFGERNGATQNEQGIYTGVQLQVTPRVTVSAYMDQYRFPWLRYRVPRPSSGHDLRLVVDHAPRSWLSYYLQLRSETRETGGTVVTGSGPPVAALVPETRQSVRLHGAYRFSDALTVRARLEASRHRVGPASFDHGILLYQDVQLRVLPGLQVDARLAFFDTDGYAARVYAYERDVLYAFSVPALYGTGQRAYLLLRAEPLEDVVLEAKYAETRFQHVDRVGSGLNETPGNRIREVRLQLRWRL
jgi:hypothetical protein